MAKAKSKTEKSSTQAPTPPAPVPAARLRPPGPKEVMPGSSPTEPTPVQSDPLSKGVQAKVVKAGKQSGESCEGCEHNYDSSMDPSFSGPKPVIMCVKNSPSVETGGKKLDPCPAEGEGIGLYQLTPEEVDLVHQHRIKQGSISKKRD